MDVGRAGRGRSLAQRKDCFPFLSFCPKSQPNHFPVERAERKQRQWAGRWGQSSWAWQGGSGMLGRESPEAGIVGPASRVPSARPVGRSQRTHLPTHDGLLSRRPQVTIVKSKEVVIQREPRVSAAQRLACPVRRSGGGICAPPLELPWAGLRLSPPTGSGRRDSAFPGWVIKGQTASQALSRDTHRCVRG